MVHRYITSNSITLIKYFEGFSPVVYICPSGWKTLGFGHAVRKGEKWDSPTVSISQEEAEELLKQDTYSAEASVSRLIQVPLEDYQFDSLVSFVYNLGGGSLQRSTLRSKLNRYEYLSASQEFGKWVYGGGRKLPGLTRRREAERILFLMGIIRI